MEANCDVRFTRRYDASPSEVWAALTEPGSIARWLAEPGEIDLSPGGAYELKLAGGTMLPARVRAIEPERLLELDWNVPGDEHSVVRVELSPRGDGTELVLDHRRVSASLGMVYMERWTGALDRLDPLLSRTGTGR